MKNLQETVKYIFKNLIFLGGFVILPSFFIGGLLQPFAVINFIVDYPTLVVSNFGDILGLLFTVDWVYALNWVLAIIILVVILSALIGNIENHFKSGKLNPSSTVNFINNNGLSVCIYGIMFLVAYNLFKLLLGLMYFVTHILFGRLGSTPTTFMVVLLVVITLAILVWIAYICGLSLLALVDTNICGYSIVTSYSDASDYMSGKVWQTIFLVVFPFVVIVPLVVLGNLYNFGTISNIVSLSIEFIYFSVLAYTMYFDYARINRYDNIKRYY